MEPVSEIELARSRAMFIRIFGEEYGTQLCNQLNDGSFNQVLMARIAPEVWEYPGIDLRTKILSVIAVSTAINQDVRYFVRAAIHHGVPQDAIEAVILMAGLEAGFPAAAVARRGMLSAYSDHAAMLQAKAVS